MVHWGARRCRGHRIVVDVLRTLDAIHLATAMALGDDLETIATYDERMSEAARLVGLSTVSPA
jgi:predicted nucleic acid-binding protein